LAEEFEVSRGPVREMLRILEKDSVVRIPPNRGAHLTQLSIKDVSDIFEVRRTLFGAMIGRLTVEEASALAAIIDADIRALDALA
jgi:DNA-binding GntR family transcriptional regulator